MKKILFFIFSLITIVLNHFANAEQNVLTIPPERGEVIFNCNGKSSNQIYIIGSSHPDTLTMANGNNTVRAQMEIYWIGEWLIENKDVQLILPESFFEKEAADEKNDLSGIAPNVALDAKTLAEKLGSGVHYLNAEMLLIYSFGVISRQVEDRDLRDSIIELIKLREGYGKDSTEAYYIMADLYYLQERRTATMLQKIPDIVQLEYGKGRIRNQKAIFTIGINHIPIIVSYLNRKKMEIAAPAFTQHTDYLSGVKLLEQDFGVTIIIPRSLMDVQELVALTKAAQN